MPFSSITQTDMNYPSMKYMKVTDAQKRGVSALLRTASEEGVVVITRNNMPSGILLGLTHSGLDNAVNLLYNAYEINRTADVDIYGNNLIIDKEIFYDMFKFIVKDIEYDIQENIPDAT